MMRYLTGLVIAGLLLSVGGCGHRKAGVPTSLPGSQRTRALVVGDNAVYDLKATFLRPDGKVSGSKTGTVTIKVGPGFKHGPIPSVVKRTFHVTEQMEIESSATGQIDWFGQASDGAIYILGQLTEGTEWALVKDRVPHAEAPAVLTGKSSWGYTMHMNNGWSETNAAKVVAVEKVSTPAGDFDAYKTEIRGTTSDGSVIRGYAWLRPEFPLFGVKNDQTITNKKTPKLRTHIVQTLKSYHFAE